MPQHLAEIGVVRSASPARREIRVTPLGAAPDKLWDGLKRVVVRLSDETELHCRVAAVRDETGGKILLMTPGVPRETVAKMKGARVMAETDEEAVRSEGFDLADLDGLEVIDRSGNPIGVVTGLYTSGMNAAMEVERTDGRALLLPVIEQVIESVDVDRGVIVVNDIEPYAVEEE